MATSRYLTADLKKELDDHDKRIGTLEQTSVRRDERIAQNGKVIERICTKTDELENVLITASVSIKIGTWIVAAFGVSVIALIWSIITGQANIVFP